MSDIGRPQNSGQKSKKGRRAWRKNVDISDIEKKLEEQRDEIIHHGKPLSEMESEDLFIIDESEDEETARTLKKHNVKKLKSSEILENKSKVPALITRIEKTQKNKSDKIQGVDKREMVKLLKLAGKVKGFNKADERLAKEGIVNSKAYDVWDTPLDNEIKDAALPAALRENSSTSFTHPREMPGTLKEAPIQIRKYEILPHAGKSYNPSLENWKHLIDQEYFREKPKEDQRLELEEYKDRIQHLIANYEDNEVREDESESEEEVEDGEKKVVEEEETVEVDMKLSINPVTKLRIKTKTQRNREQRNKDRLILEKELKDIKLRIRELEKLPSILDQVDEKEQKTVIKSQQESKHARQLRKGSKKLGKFEVIEGQIEVKLRSELSDSLRKLKPEGNMLYDQMKRLQSKGLIETRRISKGKKGKKKVSQKWSYKDFK